MSTKPNPEPILAPPPPFTEREWIYLIYCVGRTLLVDGEDERSANEAREAMKRYIPEDYMSHLQRRSLEMIDNDDF